MRSRRLRRALVVGLAVLAGAMAFAVWPRPDRVTKENFDRIRKGMSQAEVESILGPPGDYRTGPGEIGEGGGKGGEVAYWRADSVPEGPAQWPWARPQIPGWGEHRRCGGWVSDSFAITIFISDAGNVETIIGWPRRTTASALEKLLWRLKRQWRRWFP